MHLARMLESLAAQTCPPALAIVVDSSRNDLTRAVTDRFITRLPLTYLRAIEPSAAVTRSLVDGEFIDLHNSAGRICLELVEAYPQGIPIGVPGFRLNREAVTYLQAVSQAGGHIVSLDADHKPAKLVVVTEFTAAERACDRLGLPENRRRSPAIPQKSAKIDAGPGKRERRKRRGWRR